MGNLGSLYLSFSGRISRQPWWLGLLAMVVIEWVVVFILGMILGTSVVASIDPNDPAAAAAAAAAMTKAMIPAVIVGLIFLYPALALYTKRWHDRGKSGWWTLIILVPIIGSIWALVELGFLKGTTGPNQYGADPLGGRLATA
jgi:uncharacterized membrane protein YhaH (DUF805 family)